MSGPSKNVLIVYAHPGPESFNAAMKNVAVKELTDAGFDVKVSDLYAMQFKATTTKEDFSGPSTIHPFNYMREAGRAYQENRISHDIVSEVEKMKWADLLILQFPIQWFGVPAILKGWFDRVFVYGETYGFPDKVFNHGVFKGKRAIISMTTGGPKSMYEPTGINGDVRIVKWGLENGCLNLLGYSVLETNICYGVTRATEDERKSMLESWRKRVRNLFDEEPQTFFKFEDFSGYGFGSIKGEALETAKSTGKLPFGQSGATKSHL